jgi:hypothetical protein
LSFTDRPAALAALLLACALAAPAHAAVYSFEPPDVDRWLYPFGSATGARPNSPLFGAFATDGAFDQRDGQALLIFDTAPAIPAGRPLSAYTIHLARVILDRDPTGGFVYDPSQDGYRTYLALEDAGDPNALPDTDAGRPIELFGVGYRTAGLNALTYNENTTPFAVASGDRNAYPNDNRAHPTSFGNRDVSNNVLDGFEAQPFAVGVVPGAAAGSIVTGAGLLRLDFNLQNQVVAYLRQRLAQGSVDLMVTTLAPAAQGGPVVYPILLNKESGTGAARLVLDVTWTPACSDGADNDRDGQTDVADGGCTSATDDSEQFDCQDGIDNDGDGDADYPADDGCELATSPIENPQCADGADNDNDAAIDFPADAQCSSPYDNREAASSCGLLGVEGLPVLAWAAWARRRSRRRAGDRAA